MIRYIISMMLISANAVAEIDCNLLIGTWSGTFYSESEQAQNKFELIFRSDGTFTQRLVYTYHDGTGIEEDTNHALWRCEQNNYFLEFTGSSKMYREGPDKIYEINELTNVYANVTITVGDPAGETYELFRK